MTHYSDTAYLDGLRGWAAVLVYWHHHEIWAHRSAVNVIERAYGYRERYHFLALPWIRLLFNGGHYATATLFIISGFVISRRPLELIQTGRVDQLAKYLSSATFRRWMRLYLPLIATTFLYMTSWHLFDLHIRWIQPQRCYMDELRMWFAEVMDYGFPFSRIGSSWLSYNNHLWSIPVELKGSLVNYTTLLALSQSSRRARVSCQGLLIAYFMYAVRDGWYLAFFMAGMLLQEVEQWLDTRHVPSFPYSSAPILALIFLLFSMYLGGIPHCVNAACIRDNPGWFILSFLAPSIDLAYDPKWHYLLPAAVLLIMSIKRIPWLIRFFERPFSQYLGRISYSLYLVHGPVMCVFADTLYAAVGWGERGSVVHSCLEPLVGVLPLPSWGPLGMETAFLVPQIILIPLTFGLANFVTWSIDKPSMGFSRWLYQLTLVPLPDGRGEKSE